MPFTFGDDSFNVADSTGVQCIIVKGDLPVTIKWLLNSSPILSGLNGITVMKMSNKNSILNIASVEEIHRGTFECIAENKAGFTAHSSQLHVNGNHNVLL